MSFLPEDDQDYLATKGIPYELRAENVPGGAERRAILFPNYAFVGNLRCMRESQLVVCEVCDLLILIPGGYATTKLDSFYTFPRLKRSDGTDPDRATGENELFGKKWQFWSRHLSDNEWRVGIDGLQTYLNYVRRELRVA